MNGWFIMGLKYKSQICKKTGKLLNSECQMSITGKAKVGEQCFDACNRELAEEVGAVISNLSNIPKFERTTKNGKKFTTLVVRANNLQPFLHGYSKNTSIDNFNDRVEVSVIGTIPEFTILFSNIKYRIKEELDIDGVIFVPCCDFIEMYK